MYKEALFIAGSNLALAAAYKTGGVYYQRQLRDRMPEDGHTESILPFMAVAQNICIQSGLEVEFVGGPVKQSLCDPETEISVSDKEIRVSTNPDCRTIKKATLYRPNYTIRDLDILVSKIDGEPAVAKYSKELNARAMVIQKALDDYAEEIGYPHGPELSLFNYEDRYGKFMLRHYPTRTHYRTEGEIMSHSLGIQQEFNHQEPWNFVVNDEDIDIRIRTTSPVRILGRTLVRSIIARQRDHLEVYEAVDNISNKGLYDEILGEEWLKYTKLRSSMDNSFNARNALRLASKQPTTAGKLILAKSLAPLAPIIEKSYIADMMQDPDSSIYRFTAKIMGAKELKQQS